MTAPLSREQPHCMVLLSGGMDSAACVDFYQRQQFDVCGLHVSYGQLAAGHEVTAAESVARHYGIPLAIVRLEGARRQMDGEVLGRNALLVFTAIMEIKVQPAIVALGIHSGSPYYDCSQAFLDGVQAVVDGQCGGSIRVAAPFLEWTKKDIWAYCLERQVPLALTNSCERGFDLPCGVCSSCRDLEALRAR